MTSLRRHRYGAALLDTALVAIIVAWIAGRIANGGASIVSFDGREEDGVFQFYNALRRIAAGQTPGVDFQLFHGLGLPYLHYPMFVRIGQSLVGAEWVRVSVAAIVYPLSIFVLFTAYARRWSAALALTVVALAASRYVEPLYTPGNSMLSVRAFAPVLVAAAVLTRASGRGALACAAGLALSFLLGIEQAVAASLALAVATMVSTRKDDRGRSMIRLGATGALAAAITLGVMVALAGWAGTVGTLRYQLRDVPGDQAWYFGVPPHHFLGRWRDFGELWVPIVAIVVSLAILAGRWRRHGSECHRLSRRATGMSVLLLYGVFSCGSFLGIINPTYHSVIERSVLLALILEGYSWLRRQRSIRRRVGEWSARVRPWPAVAMLAIVGVSAASIASRTAQIARMMNAPVLSPRLERDLQTTDSTLRTIARGGATTAPVWSTYAGLFDARRESFQPSPDYIIHALGTEARLKYVRDFEAFRAVMVLTELPATFEFEEWLQTTSWPFYESVLRQYEVAGLTSHRILWRRLPDSGTRSPSGSVEVSVDASAAPSIRLPDPAPGTGVVQTVELNYVASNALRNAPVIGNMPRFFIDVANARNHIPITLPPRGTAVTFPVYRDSRRSVELSPRVTSLFPGASLRITRVRVREWRLVGADTSLIPPP